MIYHLKDSSELPLTGNKGDVAEVDDGQYKRVYHWTNGIWKHELGYVCPVKASDLDHEPNV